MKWAVTLCLDICIKAVCCLLTTFPKLAVINLIKLGSLDEGSSIVKNMVKISYPYGDFDIVLYPRNLLWCQSLIVKGICSTP